MSFTSVLTKTGNKTQLHKTNVNINKTISIKYTSRVLIFLNIKHITPLKCMSKSCIYYIRSYDFREIFAVLSNWCELCEVSFLQNNSCLVQTQLFENITVIFHEDFLLIVVQCQLDCGELISSMCCVGGGRAERKRGLRDRRGGSSLAGVKYDTQLISLSSGRVSVHSRSGNRGPSVLNSCTRKTGPLPFLDMWTEGGVRPN